MGSVSVVKNRIHEFHRNTGQVPTSLVLDVVDFIKFVDDLYTSHRTAPQFLMPNLGNISYMGVEILAEKQGVVLREQEDILLHYAQRVGLITSANPSVCQVCVGPWVYAVMAPTISSRVPNQFTDNVAAEVSQSLNNLGQSLKSMEATKKCACNIVTLMNSGCNCGGQ